MSGLNTFTKDELEDLRLAASAKKCSMPGAMLRKLLDSYERLLAHTGADNEMSEILTQQQRNWILDALPKGPAQDILSAIDSHESRRVRAAEQQQQEPVVTDGFIETISDKVGYNPLAWDLADPKELCREIIKAAYTHKQPQAQITVRVKRDPVSGELLADDKPQAQGEPKLLIDNPPILERIEGALQRFHDQSFSMRVPVDPTDIDVVLADCKTLLSQPRAAVPDGFKLVPIKPTPEMLKAGECSGMCGDGSVRAVEFIIDRDTVAEIYANVIAAAPAQPGEGE